MPPLAQDQLVIVHMGGLGDLVLLSEFVACSNAAHVTLVCRAEFASLPRLYPTPPEDVIGVPFNPYGCTAPEPGLLAAIGEWVTRIQTRLPKPAMLVAAGLHLSWFDWLTAAAANAGRAAACSPSPRPRGLLPVLLERFKLPAEVEFDRVPLAEGLHELERYRALLQGLGAGEFRTAQWTLPERVCDATKSRLSRWGFEPGRYLFCCPLGASGGKLKRWPAERFIAALGNLPKEQRLPLVVAGTSSEAVPIEQFAALARDSGFEAQTFSGEPEELPALAGLVALSAGYFGSDTGPMHLAAAYGRPSVAVYAGGAWPSYVPWSPGSIGVVQPMPCFGCLWDCLFGHGFCIEGIPVAPVAEALARMLSAPPAAPEIVTVETKFADAALLREAANQYRESQRDRGERLYSIVELNSALQNERRTAASLRSGISAGEAAAARLAAELDARTKTAEDRLKMLGAAHREADRLQHEAELRLGLVKRADETIASLRDELRRQTEEAARRLELVERTDVAVRELRSELELREKAINELTVAVEDRGRLVENIQREAAERLAALERVNAEAARMREIIERQETLLRVLRSRIAADAGAAEVGK